MEPTDMPSKHADTNPELSGRVRGTDTPAANEQLPRSIWQPGVVKRLADYIKHVREVDNKPDKPHKSAQPDKSSEPHRCINIPVRTCHCPDGVCADDPATYRRARGPYRFSEFTQHAADLYTCPISGSICLTIKCREWCESGVDRSKT